MGQGGRGPPHPLRAEVAMGPRIASGECCRLRRRVGDSRLLGCECSWASTTSGTEVALLTSNDLHGMVPSLRALLSLNPPSSYFFPTSLHPPSKLRLPNSYPDLLRPSTSIPQPPIQLPPSPHLISLSPPSPHRPNATPTTPRPPALAHPRAPLATQDRPASRPHFQLPHPSPDRTASA
ncbi:hypothetical protein Tco_1578448 [Tanacetum coccineum]